MIQKNREFRPIEAHVHQAIARGEVVLDSFLGSGTTVIAAERTGRAVLASRSIRSTSIVPSGAGRPSRGRRHGISRPAATLMISPEKGDEGCLTTNRPMA